MSRLCPICGHLGLISIVKRSALPAMQNYVFRHIDGARTAKSGQFELATCPACGFACNTSFDSTLLDYDEGYDNRVPSSVMSAYNKELATYLHDTYSLDNGLIVDVGCGKGTFLRTLCEMFPTVRGLGIDPSYEGDRRIDNGRVVFIKDFFAEQHIAERPSIVVCRHVLEHIPDPVSFLRSLHSALERFPETPLFLEVPDTRWILQNGAFWDFCYEHCNYFTPDSLSNALKASGARPHAFRTAFSNQYIWIECHRPADGSGIQEVGDGIAPTSMVGELTRYADDERARMSGIRQVLRDLKKDGCSIAVWGMATKGIVFCFLVDGDSALIDFCIDINPNKQGAFVPRTGHSIEAPEALRRAGSRPLAIVVMNPNYVSEIRDTCRALSLEPLFMDATGNRGCDAIAAGTRT